MSPMTEKDRARIAMHPRGTRRQITVGLLTAVLGFAAVSSAQNNVTSQGLAGARESELVQLLDDLTQRRIRLEQETRDLASARNELLAGSPEQVIAQSRDRVRALSVLTGTVAVYGPGITVTIRDASGGVGSDVLLDAVQELRDAGAEAMELNGQRIVVSTWFGDAVPKGVIVGGVAVRAPYRLKVIGDGATMATALQIPGGVADAVRTAGGTLTVDTADDVTITSVVPANKPRYAATTG